MIAVMIAGATAMVFSLLGSRFLISFFRNRGKGQPILGKEDHGPEHHQKKSGTPTMGGLAIVGSAMIGWIVAHLRDGLAFSYQALIIWVTSHLRWPVELRGGWQPQRMYQKHCRSLVLIFLVGKFHGGYGSFGLRA
jgi:UDP-N-acetylmuramyl pentapeptide phosphotransferase/UDP-N-acetylglucosamine-1-phosphate transferase